MEATKRRSQTARGLLGASVVAVCFFTYNTISIELKSDPHIDGLLRGIGLAPEQYRIGVIRTAAWITAHTHLALYRSLALLLCASAVFAGFCLLRLLERRPFFRRASPAMQWMGSAAFIALFLYYLQWLNFYERPETLPATAILTAMLWIVSLPVERLRSTLNKCLAAAALIALSALFGFIRPDIAVAMSAGVWIACLKNKGEGLSLSRPWAMAASALAGLAAGLIQLYLMRVVYPHTTYGPVKTFMLLDNLSQPREWLAFILFLLPLVWMAVWMRKLRLSVDAVDRAFLWGAVLFGLLWVDLGKIDEVRIFLPFAVVLIPLTVEVFLRMVATDSGEAG